MQITTWTPNGLIIFLIAFLSAMAMQFATQLGWKPTLRRSEALDRLDDAIGRATEMGGGVLESIWGSLRSTSIFSGAPKVSMATATCRYIATRCAELGTELTVAVASPDVLPVIEDLLRSSAIAAGKPDWYQGPGTRTMFNPGWQHGGQQEVMAIETGRYKAYVNIGGAGGICSMAGVAGRANDCVTIGGCSNVHVAGSYVAAFDYTAIGDECWALAAYLDRDPQMMGTVVGSDIAKIIYMLIFVYGVISIALGTGIPFTG